MKPKPFSALNHFTVPVAMPLPLQTCHLTAGLTTPGHGSCLPMVPKLRLPLSGYKRCSS